MKHIFTIALLLAGMNLFSQNENSLPTDQQFTSNQFSLNILTPSIEYEMALGKKSSLNFLAGLSFAYEKFLDESAHFGIYPLLQTQYRYYYNFNKRLDKGKNINNNSANYIAAVALIEPGDPVIGDLEKADGLSGVIGPAWGLQRVYGKHFKLNLNLGAGYGFNETESYLAGILGLQLGFKLGK